MSDFLSLFFFELRCCDEPSVGSSQSWRRGENFIECAEGALYVAAGSRGVGVESAFVTTMESAGLQMNQTNERR